MILWGVVRLRAISDSHEPGAGGTEDRLGSPERAPLWVIAPSLAAFRPYDARELPQRLACGEVGAAETGTDDGAFMGSGGNCQPGWTASRAGSRR